MDERGRSRPASLDGKLGLMGGARTPSCQPYFRLVQLDLEPERFALQLPSLFRARGFLPPPESRT